MSATVKESLAEDAEIKRTVNDFNINVATVNGSGSQTSNLVLFRSFFKMGIPVSGKNMFPSNIQGLQTWYRIRLNKDGYLAPVDGVNVVVCMNPSTVAEDMADVAPDGIVLYDDALPIAAKRQDVTYYPMPVRQLTKEAKLPANLRSYVANFVYVGVLAYLLDIDMDEIRAALEWNFDGKEKPVALNYGMAKAAYDWAKENLDAPSPFSVERMDGFNENKVMIDGNKAAALGAIFNGVQVVAWYPITPSSSVAEDISEYAPKLRVDPETGKATYAIIQAEDELAAIGMTIGAGWAGARSMTATSGPGISLMAEFVGLGYYAEVPAVIWDIQRVGPSTGLPTRTGQGDILSTYYLSHGDTRHPMLFPSTPKECFDMAGTAFDLAERLQTPVFVMSDLDLGMNSWVSEPPEYPEKPLDRGKIVTAEQIREFEQWGRYMDIDGDGIPYRSIAGNEHPLAAYLARGTGHNEYGIYSERPEDWERNMSRIARKFDTARTLVPPAKIIDSEDKRVGIITVGSNHEAVLEARDRLKEAGVETGYLRLLALPIGQNVRDFIADYETIFVIEMNHDGQLCTILRTDEPARAVNLISVCRNNGWPLTARWIMTEIQSKLEENVA